LALWWVQQACRCCWPECFHFKVWIVLHLHFLLYCVLFRSNVCSITTGIVYGGRLCDAMYCVQISFAVCLIMVERGLSGGNLEDANLEQVFNVNSKSCYFLLANLLYVINCLGSKSRMELLQSC
jgi:hypothetical protein